jgi:hypothetical protein
MNHWIELARSASFLAVIVIGLCGLSIVAFNLLDRVITMIAKAIGLWPFLMDAVWKYARRQNEKVVKP